MRLSYTDVCLIVDGTSSECHDTIAPMPTFRPPLSASSVLQRALFKPLGATMFALCALCAIAGATQSHAADLPVLKVGDQSLQTRGILEASGQLKDLPYKIEWFNFPAAQPLGARP